jgi:hypothetical protein
MMVAILHFFPDETGIHDIVRRLVGALPSGSFLVISHIEDRPGLPELAAEHYSVPGADLASRTEEQFAEFFQGTELVHGPLAVNRILPDMFVMFEEELNSPEPMAGLAAIGRKP